MRGYKGKKEFQIRNKVKEGKSFGNALKRKEGRFLGNGGSTWLFPCAPFFIFFEWLSWLLIYDSWHDYLLVLSWFSIFHDSWLHDTCGNCIDCGASWLDCEIFWSTNAYLSSVFIAWLVPWLWHWSCALWKFDVHTCVIS